jgi:hypothetical protein
MFVAVLSLMSIIFESSSERIGTADRRIAEIAGAVVFVARAQRHPAVQIEAAVLELAEHLDHDGDFDCRCGRHRNVGIVARAKAG